MSVQAKSPLLRRLLCLLNDDSEKIKSHDDSRRSFLKSGLLVTAGISAGLSPEHLFASNTLKPRIAIIGAGLAGLSCAWELKKSGIEASIYEADTRPGGRIQSRLKWPEENNWVELGAEFINTDHKAVLGLCSELGLSLLDKQSEKAQDELEEFIAVINQTRYSTSQIKDALKNFAPIVLSDYKQIYSSEKVFQQFDALSLTEYLEGKEIESWFKQLLNAAFTSEFGLDPDSQTCINLIELLGTAGEENDEVFGSSDERFVIQGGNSLLPQTLASKMESQLNYGVPLTAITPIGSGFQLSFKNKKPLNYDIVVLAIPLAQIPKIDLSKVALPAIQREAFREMGYGQNNKLILGFQEAFWSSGANPSSGNAIHDQLHNLWWSTQMQEGRSAALTVFMGGSKSLNMAKVLRGIQADSETDLLQAYLNEVEYAFPNATSRFSWRWQTALWTDHPFQQGSYACFKPGQISRYREILAKPFGQLHFAGEYASLEHQGYMNGAAESGISTARKIKQQLKVKPKSVLKPAGRR